MVKGIESGGFAVNTQKTLRTFVIPEDPGSGRIAFLDSISVAILTETILGFTQGQDDFIYIFSQGISQKLPYLRIDVADETSVDQVMHSLKRRIAAGQHAGHFDITKARGTARKNIEEVAQALNNQHELREIGPNSLSALVVATLVKRDYAYKEKRPGVNSPLLYKSCLYILSEVAQRKRTAIPVINEILADAATYISSVSREQFIEDYEKYVCNSLMFLGFEEDSGEKILSQMDEIIQLYNAKRSVDEQVKPPLCLRK